MRDRIIRLFERLDDIKFTKKQLMLALMAIEIVGILSLVWYLRQPLIRKYLLLEPKSYSVLVMNTTSKYVAYKGDFITGKTIPNTKVRTLFTPDKLRKSIITDKNGNWAYKIPDDLKNQRYRFTVGYFDKKNKLTFFKTYRVRVASNNKLVLFKDQLLKPFSGILRLAKAQEGEVEGEQPLIEAVTEIAPQTPPELTEAPPDVSIDQPPAASSQGYSVTIVDLGTDSDLLEKGKYIQPTVLVFNQNGEVIDRGDFKVEYSLVSPDGQEFNLIAAEDCAGIRTCFRQIPEDIPDGNYNLTANLYVDGQGLPTPSQGVNINIGSAGGGQPEVTVESDAAVQNLSNGPCYGDLCPEQAGVKLVPLNNLYLSNPLYDISDGTALNLTSDCGEGCLMPDISVVQRYKQDSIDTDSLNSYDDSGKDELINCLRGTKTHPSSSLSTIASLGLISNAYGQTDFLKQNPDYILNQLVDQNLIACFVGFEEDDNFQKFAGESLNFSNIKIYKNSSFENLESYYKSFGYPVITQIKYNQSDPHYAVVAAITDNYVWVIDPLDPLDGEFAERFDRQVFIDYYYGDTFWTITPKNNTYLALAPNGSIPGGSVNLDASGRRFNDYLARGQIYHMKFLPDDSKENQLPLFGVDEKGNYTGQVLEVADEKTQLYIQGVPYGSFSYRGFVQGQNGYFDFPMNRVLINQGNLIENPLPPQRRVSWIGTRVNRDYLDGDGQPATSSESDVSFEDDLLKLGTDRIRIALGNVDSLNVDNYRPLFEISRRHDLSILLLINPQFRIEKSELKRKMGYLFDALNKAGVKPEKVAFEFGNEYNLCQYWQDFEPLSTDLDGLKAVINRYGAVQDAKEKLARKYQEEKGNNSIDCEVFRRVIGDGRIDKSIGMFFKDLRDVIQGSDFRDSKMVVGAVATQGNTDEEDARNILNIFLNSLKNEGLKLRDFDFAFHGYNVWEDPSKGNDGILRSYKLYADNSIIKEAKSGQRDYLWMTEVAIDLLWYEPQDWELMLLNLRELKEREGLLNSIYIHEFSGLAEANNFWVLRENDTGVKYPNYNIIQQMLINYNMNL